MKYTLVTISGIHTQIAKKTEVKGYTEGVLSAFLTDSEDEEECRKWIAQNNKRMKAICKFMNDNNL